MGTKNLKLTKKTTTLQAIPLSKPTVSTSHRPIHQNKIEIMSTSPPQNQSTSPQSPQSQDTINENESNQMVENNDNENDNDNNFEFGASLNPTPSILSLNDIESKIKCEEREDEDINKHLSNAASSSQHPLFYAVPRSPLSQQTVPGHPLPLPPHHPYSLQSSIYQPITIRYPPFAAPTPFVPDDGKKGTEVPMHCQPIMFPAAMKMLPFNIHHPPPLINNVINADDIFGHSHPLI